jgi:fluoride exporter
MPAFAANHHWKGDTVKNLLLVGAGGFFGSILRFLVSEAMARRAEGKFPVGTLTVNLVGCLLIGVLAGMAARRDILSAEMRLLLVTGFLGGFTTFSAFGLETVSMLRRGKWGLAILYVGVSVVLGVALTALGMKIAEPSAPVTTE